MNGENFQHLFEASFHRKLTAEEEAQIAAHFAGRLDPTENEILQEEEIRLNSLLRQIPDAPLSSNFTARVLQAAARADASRFWRPRLSWPPWFGTGALARTTAACAASLALVAVAGLSYREYVHAAREELARGVAEASALATLPNLDLLENFEVILRLEPIHQKADDELLAALQ